MALATGRLSQTTPNMQNIQPRDERSYISRETFFFLDAAGFGAFIGVDRAVNYRADPYVAAIAANLSAAQIKRILDDPEHRAAVLSVFRLAEGASGMWAVLDFLKAPL